MARPTAAAFPALCPLLGSVLSTTLLGMGAAPVWETVVGAPALLAQEAACLRVAAVSTRADMVSGGDVLVRVDAPPGIPLHGLTIERNGADVTSSFRPAREGQALIGLVTELAEGANRVVARVRGDPASERTLDVTNHPITGPLFTGPHEQPFYCSTHLFERVTDEVLGPALDEDCSAERRVDYVYRSQEGEWKPLPSLAARPADLVTTTTTDGRSVPFVVRVETGTINRAIYELAMLHDPAQPVPDPWTQNGAWNGRLIYRFGGGCREGWFSQGTNTGGVLDEVQLSRGYATASATLNVFGNNCSDLLAAETMMMVKERFSDAYGPPRFTIGWGSSGGAHQQHGIGDNYPGLLDGLMPGASFPDVTSATIFKLVDGRLLERYFAEIAPGMFTQEQQRAVSGFGSFGSIANQSDGAHRVDPDSEFQDVVPVEARYHPVNNPRGARGTVYDHTVNVYGRDPITGFALRPLDNVGVQYGLATLNDGVITKEQFLHLNEHIGGLDRDANHQPERTEGDLAAIGAAYRTGRITWGGGGLASVPMIDWRRYVDLVEQGDNHQRLHSFQIRDRLVRANGNADNHVILVWDREAGTEHLYAALAQMDQWLVNLEADKSSDPQPVKIARARPADLVDACWTKSGEKIAERQNYENDGRCGELYPAFPVPRLVAGAPLANDIVKCHLKPIDFGDYEVEFTAAERARLERIFPAGVCDWSKPGVEQQPSETWWMWKSSGAPSVG